MAHVAGADLKIGRSVQVDLRRKQKLVRVVPDRNTIAELDHCQAVIEDFKCGFLPFALKNVPHNEDWLSFSLDPQVSQSMLGSGRAGKLAAGAGSDRRHAR